METSGKAFVSAILLVIGLSFGAHVQQSAEHMGQRFDQQLDSAMTQ